MTDNKTFKIDNEEVCSTVFSFIFALPFFVLLHLQTVSPCLEFAQTMEYVIENLFNIKTVI